MNIFNIKLEETKVYEFIAFHVEDMPVVIKYPSADEVYFREDVKLSEKKTYWKDINFGMFVKPTGYDEDILIKMLETSLIVEFH